MSICLTFYKLCYKLIATLAPSARAGVPARHQLRRRVCGVCGAQLGLFRSVYTAGRAAKVAERALAGCVSKSADQPSLATAQCCDGDWHGDEAAATLRAGTVVTGTAVWCRVAWASGPAVLEPCVRVRWVSR